MAHELFALFPVTDPVMRVAAAGPEVVMPVVGTRRSGAGIGRSSSFGRKHWGSSVRIRPHFLMNIRIKDIQIVMMIRTIMISSVCIVESLA